MGTLERYLIVIPPLWEKDWRAAVGEADGAEKHLRLNQLRAVNQAKTLPSAHASAEPLAWLGFWTKSFLILEAARGALSRNSEFTLHAIQRAATDLTLQMHVVLAPILRLVEAKKLPQCHVSVDAKERAWSEVVDRMRAHAAWCLWNDQHYWESVVRPGVLEAIWDPQPTRETVKDQGLRTLHEGFFGPLDLMNEHELERERQEHRTAAASALERIRGWLSDGTMSPWVARIRERRTATKPIPSFYELFDDEGRSVCGCLKNMDLAFAYVPYMQESMLLHSSTLDLVLSCGQDALCPDVVGSSEVVEVMARGVGDECARILLELELVRQRIWT